jgi:hypothetical protein
MTIEGALFLAIAVMLMFNWPVAVILWRGARGQHITALRVMAVATTLIAVGLTTYVLAVINSVAGNPLPQPAMQVLFRLVLLGLAIFPLWFLSLYRRGFV